MKDIILVYYISDTIVRGALCILMYYSPKFPRAFPPRPLITDYYDRDFIDRVKISHCRETLHYCNQGK
jgi:hypothetical protein